MFIYKTVTRRIFSTFLISSILLLSFTIFYKSSVSPLTKFEDSPIVERIPGGYVKHIHPIPSNYSYCNFHFGLPINFEYSRDDLNYSPELKADSPYRIIYNVIESQISGDIPRVTYATHVSANFISFVAELVRFWDGPISVAAFVPAQDAQTVLDQIVQYCYCIPQMNRVSLHLVFHRDIPPTIESAYFRKPTNCILKDSNLFLTYRSLKNIIYPVNVCRNVARSSAVTNYVMVSDSELMPSDGLARKFLQMLEKDKCIGLDCYNRVFVVPIFEVESTENLPRNKKQLLTLVSKEKAVYFHRLICTHCQKFPGIEAWLKSDPAEIQPFLVTRREAPYDRWEPIYIGTRTDPFYSETLSWEGLQDKMLQMLEMCLMKYKFVILDGAFLVHWPGIKKMKTTKNWRVPFKIENSRQYNKILKNLSEKYDPSPQCKLK